MDIVSIGQAVAQAKKKMVDSTGRRLDSFEALGRKDSPPMVGRAILGSRAIPGVDASVATVEVSASGAASSIGSPQWVIPSAEKFTVFAAAPVFGAVGTGEANYWLANRTWAKTSASPWAVEFDLDAAGQVFEVLSRGTASTMRASINGKLADAVGVTVPGDGGAYLVKVSLPSASVARVRLEFSSNFQFGGIYVGPTDLVQAGARRIPRYAWIGDSFGEPTISDTNPKNDWMGMPQMFGYCTDLDVVSASSGGTGLVNPGSGGRVKFRDRLAEVLTFPGLTGIIIQMSGNDMNFPTGDVVSELALCIAMARSAGFTRAGQIIVVSTWWKDEFAPSSLVDKNDAGRAKCAELGIPFVDTLTPPIASPAVAALTSATSTGSNNLYMSAPMPIRNYVKIGTGATAEIRKVTNGNVTNASTPPYQVQVNQNPGNAHAAGEPVTQVGAPLLTGNGKQGTPNGSGNAERMTGPDGTHPTILGARARGIQYANGLGRVLAT